MNPGFVALRDNQLTRREAELVQDRDKSFEYCGFCGHNKPLRSRHCDSCGLCVRKFDHHCPCLGQCVGERNHSFFMAYLIIESLIIGWTMLILYQNRWRLLKEPWENNNFLLLVSAIVCFLLFILTSCLSIFHSILLLKNFTTREFLERHKVTYLRNNPKRNPFDEGVLKNILLCLRPPKDRSYWYKVYTKNFNDNSLDPLLE